MNRLVLSARLIERGALRYTPAGLPALDFRLEHQSELSEEEQMRKVSVQISTEEVYREFPARSVQADIHGILMRVASLPDTLQGKILAYRDAERRASKRQKDLLDITRLVEAHPKLKKILPADVARKIKAT